MDAQPEERSSEFWEWFTAERKRRAYIIRNSRLDADWAEVERTAEKTLESAGLDGWATNLRVAGGRDPVRLVRALDGIVNRDEYVCGTDPRAPGSVLRVDSDGLLSDFAEKPADPMPLPGDPDRAGVPQPALERRQEGLGLRSAALDQRDNCALI